MIICLSIRTQGNSIPVYTHHDIKGVKKMPNIKSAKKRVKVNAKKAAANNLIHKNCAARKKSNLAKKVNA